LKAHHIQFTAVQSAFISSLMLILHIS
jgi:hypothetical protein